MWCPHDYALSTGKCVSNEQCCNQGGFLRSCFQNIITRIQSLVPGIMKNGRILKPNLVFLWNLFLLYSPRRGDLELFSVLTSKPDTRIPIHLIQLRTRVVLQVFILSTLLQTFSDSVHIMPLSHEQDSTTASRLSLLTLDLKKRWAT